MPNPIAAAKERKRGSKQQTRALAFKKREQHKKWKIDRDKVFAQKGSKKTYGCGQPCGVFFFLPSSNVGTKSHGKKTHRSGIPSSTSRSKHKSPQQSDADSGRESRNSRD